MNRKKLCVFLLVCLFVVLSFSTGIAAGGRGGNGYCYGGGSTSTSEDNTSGHKGSGAGTRGSQGGPGTDHGGTITLKVTVKFMNDGQEVFLDREVDVTLFREDIPTTVTTVDGVATFYSEASGDCLIKGADVPGYLTPEKDVSLTGRNKTIEEELVYIASYIPVNGVEINQDELKLIEGYEGTLTAAIIPANASNHTVNWDSDDETVATVDEGLVTAMSEGTADITVTTEDGGKTALCAVTVVRISDLLDPDAIDVLKGQVVILPETVTAQLSDATTAQLDVDWKYGDIPLEDIITIPDVGFADSYTLTGSVKGTDLVAAFVINVIDAQHAIPVSAVNLDSTGETLTVGESFTLTPSITPAEATVQDVVWHSSDETVATVDAHGKVTAVSPGWSIITVTTIDGGHEDYCTVSVIPEAEVVLIYTTDQEGSSEVVTEFPDGARESVFVNVENLVQSLTAPTVYFVKVEQRGAGSVAILGDGQVELSADSVTFNLFDVTQFDFATSYSNEYFISISADPSFPLGDELTVSTNFKIGLATPTVPQQNITVTNTLIGGNRQPQGIIFILARELGGTDVSDLSWHDYYNGNYNPDDPYDETNPVEPIVDFWHFSDEVKMIGITNTEGLVEWMPPRETLKLGGYVLLQVTPKCYTDNLNMVNPDSHDFNLLKEVHLTRNGTVVVNVITTYQPRD